MSLKTFKSKLRTHMIRNGMFNVFCIKDDNDDDFNLFQKHARFTLNEVKHYLNKRETYGLVDTFEFENLTYSGMFIRNSIGPDLLHQLHQEVGISASGPVTFVALMRIIFSDGYDAIEEIKMRLKNIKLSTFS